jgi:methanogenic corrinoid protein MtbC1
VVQPHRSDGNQRLYSEADVERLTLLKQATDAGHRISHISTLPTEELRDLIAQIAPLEHRPPRPATPSELALADGFLGIALAAIQQFDNRWLKTALEQASAQLPAPVFLQDLLVPLLHRIGDLWAEGGLHPAHEHAATAVVRGFLDNMRHSQEIKPGAPVIVMTTLAHEFHELGALLASAIAAGHGWDVTYLGPNLPAEDIALVARQKDARAVGLSIVNPEIGSSVREELHKLRRHLGPGRPIIVGGQGSSSVSETVTEIEAVRVENLIGLLQVLDSLRAANDVAPAGKLSH